MSKLDGVLGTIDRISEKSGSIAKWFMAACFFVVFYDVVARYLFNSATIWAYDMAYFFYAANFLLAGCYVQRHHSHIRVDVIFNLLSQRNRAILEACFYIVLTIPLIAILTYSTIIFAADSWLCWEASMYTVWHPPVYPIKTVIALGYSLLLLQALSDFVRCLRTIVEGDSAL